MNKNYSLLMMGFLMILGLSLVSCSNQYGDNVPDWWTPEYGVQYQETNQYTEMQLKQVHINVMNRYNFHCYDNCTYNFENDKLQLEVREQKQLWLFKFEQKVTYDLTPNGEIERVRQNLWSRIFNQEVING